MDGSDCDGSPVLATICTKIENIQKDIHEIKQDQKDYLERCQQADIDRAKYPSPSVVQRYIKTVDRHDVYFYFMGAVIGILAMWVSGLIPRFFGWM